MKLFHTQVYHRHISSPVKCWRSRWHRCCRSLCHRHDPCCPLCDEEKEYHSPNGKSSSSSKSPPKSSSPSSSCFPCWHHCCRSLCHRQCRFGMILAVLYVMKRKNIILLMVKIIQTAVTVIIRIIMPFISASLLSIFLLCYM